MFFLEILKSLAIEITVSPFEIVPRHGIYFPFTVYFNQLFTLELEIPDMKLLGYEKKLNRRNNEPSTYLCKAVGW